MSSLVLPTPTPIGPNVEGDSEPAHAQGESEPKEPLQQKVDHLTAAHKAELSDKESTVRLEMVNAIEAAFQKGYNQCSAAMNGGRTVARTTI